MGNSIGGRRKGAKVMQLDGTAFRVKPPAQAGAVLRDHPGFQLLESEQVKLLGVRARPLDHDALLRPGRLYFLVALPRPAVPPRRAWSGALHVGARERLESLMLTRRSTSDLSFPTPGSPLSTASEGGPVQLRMRLPKAQVAKLMGESRDAAEAAAKIMQLCAANGVNGAVTPEQSPRFLPTADWGTAQTPERSPRSVPTPDWGGGRFAQTPERSPRFAVMPTPERGAEKAKTPDRWPTLPRTPEYASADVKAYDDKRSTVVETLLKLLAVALSPAASFFLIPIHSRCRRFCFRQNTWSSSCQASTRVERSPRAMPSAKPATLEAPGAAMCPRLPRAMPSAYI